MNTTAGVFLCALKAGLQLTEVDGEGEWMGTREAFDQWERLIAMM